MSTLWKNDDELFAMAKEQLFVALVGDTLDKLGYHHQFLSPHLKPLQNQMVIIGRAMPVLEADFFGDYPEGHASVSNIPFGLMFQALDDLKKNEVYICSGSSHRYALWGGLMSTRAMQCGAAVPWCTAFIAIPTKSNASVSRWLRSAVMPRTRGFAARSWIGGFPLKSTASG